MKTSKYAELFTVIDKMVAEGKTKDEIHAFIKANYPQFDVKKVFKRYRKVKRQASKPVIDTPVL